MLRAVAAAMGRLVCFMFAFGTLFLGSLGADAAQLTFPFSTSTPPQAAVTDTASGTTLSVAGGDGFASFVIARPAQPGVANHAGNVVVTMGPLTSVRLSTGGGTFDLDGLSLQGADAANNLLVLTTDHGSENVTFASTSTSADVKTFVSAVLQGVTYVDITRQDAGFLAIAIDDVKLTVAGGGGGGLPQAITFNNPGTRTFGTPLNVTVTSDSGLLVDLASGTSAVCTLESVAGNTFTIVFGSAGICTLTATQGGDATFAAATPVTHSFTVNAVVPSAPTIGTATAGNGDASVTFTPPASNGGSAITGYTATSTPDNLTGSCTAPCGSIIVSGLTGGTSYTFTVTASNSAGTGPASAASNAVTPVLTCGAGFAPSGGACVQCNPGTFSATGTSCHACAPDTFAATFGSVSCTTCATGMTAPSGALSCTPKTYAIAAVASPSAAGTVTCSPNPVGHGQSSTCTASGATGYLFTGFSGDCSGLTCTLSDVQSAKSVVANFLAGPVVTSVDVPAAGTFGIGSPLDFVVHWSENVIVTGTPRLPITVGTTIVNAVYSVAGSAGSSTLFRYIPQEPDSDTDGVVLAGLDLNGGTIRNAGGADANLALSSVADTTAVHVDGIRPVVGVGSASATSTVATFPITASEPVQAYWSLYPSGSPPPSVAQVIVATGGAVSNGHDSATAGTTSHSASGLAPNTTYVIYVAAKDLAGNATTAVASTTIITSAGLPGTPSNLSAEAGNSIALISFSPPVSDGGAAITAYRVSCTAGGGVPLVVTAAISPITITGLTPGVSYACTVSAINAVGTGPASAPLAVTPLDACAASPCQNGGTCVPSGSTYSCVCASGFSGVTCNVPLAAKLAFTTQPSGGVAGQALSAQPVVAVQSASGANVSSSATVSLALTIPGGATLSCTSNHPVAILGIATFQGCSVSAPGVYTLTATAPGLTAAVSQSFTVVADCNGNGTGTATGCVCNTGWAAPNCSTCASGYSGSSCTAGTGPATKLTFASSPVEAVAGAAFPIQPLVRIADRDGNLVSSSEATVTLALLPFSAATLSCAGGATRAAVLGQVAFNGCSIDKPGTYTLSATSSGLTSATSATFAVTCGVGQVSCGSTPSVFMSGPATSTPGTIVKVSANVFGTSSPSGRVDFTISSIEGQPAVDEHGIAVSCPSVPLATLPKQADCTFTGLPLGAYVVSARYSAGPTSASASFHHRVEDRAPKLTVFFTGSGQVVSSPAGITCAQELTLCEGSFPKGTAVVLTATGTSGSNPAGWTGMCAGTTSPSSCTIPSLDADGAAGVQFEQVSAHTSLHLSAISALLYNLRFADISLAVKYVEIMRELTLALGLGHGDAAKLVVKLMLSPATASSGTSKSALSDAQYVAMLYRALFNRTVDGSGLAFWSSQLASGTSRDALLEALFASAEYASFWQNLTGEGPSPADSAFVADLYRVLMVRAPDYPGFSFFLSRLQPCLGDLFARVAAASGSFFTSQEYRDRGRTNAEFIEDAYLALLRRPPDPAGRAFWLGELDGGRERSELLIYALASEEFRQARLQALGMQACGMNGH